MTIDSQTSMYPVLDLMREEGLPLTREVYIQLNWWGEKPHPWTAEHEEELPPQFRRSG